MIFVDIISNERIIIENEINNYPVIMVSMNVLINHYSFDLYNTFFMEKKKKYYRRWYFLTIIVFYSILCYEWALF